MVVTRLWRPEKGRFIGTTNEHRGIRQEREGPKGQSTGRAAEESMIFVSHPTLLGGSFHLVMSAGIAFIRFDWATLFFARSLAGIMLIQFTLIQEGPMASHIPLRLCSAAVLAAAICSTLPAAHAATYIGSATATIDNLRYRLVDLDLDDGIAPSVSFHGDWSTYLRQSTDRSTSPYSSWPEETRESVRSAQDGQIVPASGLQHSQAAGGGGVYLTDHTFTVQSTLTSDHIQAYRQPFEQIYTSSQYLGNNQYRDEIRTYQTDILKGHGKTDNVLHLHESTPTGVDPSTIRPLFNPAGFTLSANTQLIIEATVSAHFTLDRSYLKDTIAQWRQDVADFDLEAPGLQNGAGGSVWVSASIGADILSEPTPTNSFGLMESAGFDDHGLVTGYEYGPNGIITYYDDALTGDKLVQKEMQISFSNVTGANQEGQLAFYAETSMEQIIYSRAFGVSVSTAIRNGDAPGGVPTWQVPEPDTALIAAIGVAMSWLLGRRMA